MAHSMIQVGDYLFKQKNKYDELTNEDKETFFFIMNRKFARQYPKHAQFFNNKIVDKASAMDIWYQFFIKKRINYIPQWYWFKMTKKTDKSILKKEQADFFKEFYDIRNEDLAFIEEHYIEELKLEVKKFKKFNKK